MPWPDGMAAQFRLREASHQQRLGSSYSAKAQIEVHNTGGVDISHMKVRADVLGASGDVIASKEINPNMKLYPPIRPGQHRVFTVSEPFLDVQSQGVALTVLEAQ